MKYEIVDLEEKILVGISSKTANNDPEAGKKIGQLWEKMFAEEVFNKIENKKSKYPICLYSDYKKTDVTGENLEYDVTIGFDATQANNKDFTIKKIPAGKYAKFLVKGNVATATAEAWQKIWQLPLKRKFTGDFEEYLNNSMEQAEINIYVALA